MILGKNLVDIRPQIRIQQGGEVTLEAIERKLHQIANGMGVPMSFAHDKVQFGGLIGSLVGSNIEECLTVCNPSHPSDYFNYAIRVKHQGVYAFVSIQSFGSSRQLKKEAIAENYKQDRRGKALSYQIGSRLGQAVATIGKNAQKIEEEKNWYAMANDVFDQLFQ